MKLETNSLRKHFGGVAALDDVSVEFPAGQVTAVIGPNGAGKTTLFNVMAGFVTPDSGSVHLISDETLGGKCIELTRAKPHEIAREGVGVLFQDIRVFSHLSVLDNVATGFRHQAGENPLTALGRNRVVRAQERSNLETARRHLDFVGLGGKADLAAGNLSYGEQKLVALARLLAADASVLLLDEPTAGIHVDRIAGLLALIARLAGDSGKAVIIVEHNLNVVRAVGDWVYLMARGRVEVFGKPSEVLSDDSLQSLFPTL